MAVRRREPNEKRWRSLAERPAHAAESDALNKNFKPHGFKLDGSAIISALMQTTGMVKDHLVSYPRQAELGGSSSLAPKASKRA